MFQKFVQYFFVFYNKNNVALFVKNVNSKKSPLNVSFFLFEKSFCTFLFWENLSAFDLLHDFVSFVAKNCCIFVHFCSCAISF